MQTFGGISRYFFELINNAQNSGFQAELSLVSSSNEYLQESKNVKIPIHLPIQYHARFYRLTNKINRKYSQAKIKLGNFDILHPTFYEEYFIGKTKKPYVITVYDLINERYPQYFSNNQEFINRKKKLMENASRIIAISENTKKDIVEYFNIKESKIDVTYLAESLSIVTATKVENLPLKYLLFIGKRGGYKNFETMYQGIKEILAKYPELFLVCAGGGDFSTLENEQFVADKIGHKIKYISFSKNEELKYLYEKAVCFIFPSLYEGFGIPVLESFASGCLICTSFSSSLKEIGGDSVLYFDPHSPLEIEKAIEQALSLDKKNKFTDRGLIELQKYSWLKTTEQTFDVYKKC
jgi:glycosyltransferase involved in cell wall biosynthesis